MSKRKSSTAKTRTTKKQTDLVDKYARQFNVIQELNQLIGSDEKAENVLRAALKHITQTLTYRAAQIYQLSPSSENLWLYLELGNGSKPVTQTQDIFLVTEENIISDTVRKGEPTYIADVHLGPYSYYGKDEEDLDIASELALPLRCGQVFLGVLRIQSDQFDAFSETDRNFFASLSSLLASVIKNGQTVEQLKNDLQEIKILYGLKHSDEIDKRLAGERKNILPGYQYNRNTVEVAEIGTLPAVAKIALGQEQMGVTSVRDQEHKELVAPIKLYGETIGVLGIEGTAEGKEWTTDDIRLLEEVSSQVALAIENSRLLQQTQERTNELAILFETSRQLSETVNLQQNYEILATQILKYLDADLCSISLFNKAKTHLTEILVKGKGDTQSEPIVTIRHSESAPEAVDDYPGLQPIVNQPEIIIEHLQENVAAAELLVTQGEVSATNNGEGANYHSEIHTRATFPIVVRNKLIGILRIGHFYQRRDYTKNELQLAEAIISQATVSIENTQLFDQTQNTLAETQRLYDISRSLVEVTTLEDVFNIVIGNVTIYDVDRVSISLLDRNETGDIEKVTIVANWDSESDQILPVGSEVSAGMFSLVEAFAQPPFSPLISEDLSQPEAQDPRMDEAFRRLMYEELGAQTLFSAPMFVGSEYKGVLSISTRKPHIYTQQEMRIYQTLADQAIIAIERHRLLDATRQERDRAALLHEFAQKTSQTRLIEEVQDIVLSFTHQVGATYGEIYVTDGSFFSIASTIPERQTLSPAESTQLARTMLSNGIEAEALQTGQTVLRNKGQFSQDVETIPDIKDIDAIICTPYRSRRSDLRGVITFFNSDENGFTNDQISMFESIAMQTAETLENVWLLEQTGNALNETELLYNATRDFNSAQHLEDILATLVNSFILSVGSTDGGLDHMAIALINTTEDDGTLSRLDILANWDRQAATTQDQSIINKPDYQVSIENYPFIKQINSNTPYEIRHDQSEEVQRYLDEYLGKARAALSIPLTVGNNWLGMLFIASRLDQFVFKPEIVSQIATLAGQAAVVIQNLQLVEETQQNLYNSEILSHLSQELLVADTAESIYKLTLDAIAATEPDRGAAIFMYDQAEGGVDLEIVATWDSLNEDWPALPIGSHLSAKDLGLTPLLKTGHAIVSKQVSKDEQFSAALQQLLLMMEIESLVAVPIWLDKEVNGFILIGNQISTTFGLETIRLYENISRLISGALENRYLFEAAQHRAAQLQTAAEVSQAAASYLDMDRILSESVYLLRDRFGFYHVSIFLVDEYQQHAIIQASTGEVGRKMLAQKRKFEVGGQSIVGTAAGTGKPRVALDVGEDAVYFSDPLLPDTRSEMALPLIARGRVIGALDVHSTQKGAFAQSDITILQTMANQLANAIEAARSFKESKKALDDVSKLHEKYLREEWTTFLREQKTATGYRLTDDNLFILPEEDTWSSEKYLSTIDQAIEAKHPVIVPSSFVSKPDPAKNGKQQTANTPVSHNGETDPAQDNTTAFENTVSEDIATLVAPLTLHGQVVIGAVDFEFTDEEREWDEDTLQIVEAVTNQAAQVIEAARLFEQTQAAREEAETLYQVSQALVAAETEYEMLEMVLEKTLSTLGLKQGGILFFEEDKKFGKLHALFENGKPVKPDLRFPIEGNPSYQKLIKTKKSVAIEDAANDPLLVSVRDINRQRNIASLLLVPLIINDEVVGAMGADVLGQQRAFTDREINLTGAMADQLSIILQNRRLLEETRRGAIQLQTSTDVARVATSILDQDDMLEQAVKLIKDRFGFYHAQIFLVDEAYQYAVLNKSTGEAGRQLLAKKYKVAVGDQNVIGQVAQQRKSIVVRDLGSNEVEIPYQRNEFLPQSRAELAVPLQVGETLIGIMDVHSVALNDFTEADIATMETLGAQLSIAIQNAQAFREEQETAERLKEIDKLKTQFLANMSHELRTPLNSIIGFSRVILKGIDGPLTELQKADLTSIHNSGQHLLGLINNILDLSKIGAGKMELNFEEIEIGPIVKGIMSTAIALVKDKPVKLVQDVPDELPSVWADPTRIRQVVLNLVSNACKFTDEGAVTLKTEAAKEKIIISVSDTGIGIPEENLESIFEEFTQVDASTTRKVGGTGLGLPISRHFVEMHQGQIWVDSQPGRGSTFSFAIPIHPLSKNSELPAQAEHEPQVQDGENRTIVAIDDDTGVITLYERFLTKHNYKVTGIKNDEDLVDRVKAYTPFAILLDVLMPNKDGWSILKDLKADPLTKDVPVIICSIVNDKNRGFSLGAADYLTKPIVESELINALKQLDDQAKEQVKVLVIDDQADDILLIRRMLEVQANYKIIEASNGKEGLELVKSRHPDLLILDLTMPEMDGFMVVEALKDDEKTRKIPIIIVSAKELTSAENQRLSGQVEVFLRKGIFTENELVEDVSKALERVGKNELMI